MEMFFRWALAKATKNKTPFLHFSLLNRICPVKTYTQARRIAPAIAMPMVTYPALIAM